MTVAAECIVPLFDVCKAMNPHVSTWRPQVPSPSLSTETSRPVIDRKLRRSASVGARLQTPKSPLQCNRSDAGETVARTRAAQTSVRGSQADRDSAAQFRRDFQEQTARPTATGAAPNGQTVFFRLFPTRQALVERFPKLSAGLDKLDALGQGAYQADLATLLDKKSCSQLHAAFGPSVTTYGLAALLGIGKGKMSTLLALNNASMKSSPELLVAGGPKAMQARAGRCLDMARHLIAKVVAGLDDPRDKVLLGAMAVHFRSAPFSVQHGMAQDRFRRLGDELSQHVVLTVSGESSAAKPRLGSVPMSPVECASEATVSPHKTIHPFTHKHSIAYGNIHIDAHSLAGEKVDGYASTDSHLAKLIVHEASHKFLGTDDLAYVTDLRHDTVYSKLDEYDRLKNADCFAYVAASVGAGRLISHAHDLSFMEIPEEKQPEICFRESADDPVYTDSDSSSESETEIDGKNLLVNRTDNAEDDVAEFMRSWAKRREEQGLGHGGLRINSNSSGDTSSEIFSSDSESTSLSQ